MANCPLALLDHAIVVAADYSGMTGKPPNQMANHALDCAGLGFR